MAVGKEIRDQIRSISSTQKITSAMEMVAASKMRKAQDRMNSSKPYSESIMRVASHVAHSSSEYKHSFLDKRDVKRVGLIVVSSDRGLCGGLNINLFREMLLNLKDWDDKKIEVDFSVIGNKAKDFISGIGKNIISEVSGIGDSPSLVSFIGSVKSMIDLYEDGKIDQLFIIYNEFLNSMTQKPLMRQLLPLDISKTQESSSLNHHWDYIYEPEAKTVMETLFTRYIESLVYQSVVENIACEQSARMLAMKNATDNAGDLIDNLQLIYNKARQASITAELADIVGGAAAVS